MIKLFRYLFTSSLLVSVFLIGSSPMSWACRVIELSSDSAVGEIGYCHDGYTGYPPPLCRDMCTRTSQCKNACGSPFKTGSVLCKSDSDCQNICDGGSKHGQSCLTDEDCPGDAQGQGQCKSSICNNIGRCLDDDGNELLATLIAFEVNNAAQNDEMDLEFQWTTASELNNLGFNIWCATMQLGTFQNITKLNEELISTQAQPNAGWTYSLLANSHPLGTGVQYCTVEDIDNQGQCTLHCDFIDVVAINDRTRSSDLELKQLNSKAINLCNTYQQALEAEGTDQMCLDQLLGFSL